MAIASKWMGAYFNRPGFEMFNFDVYAMCGDGDMMEGVSSEAASLAAHLRLNNLCWIYDNNKITIEGHTDWAFSEDVATRFIGYGKFTIAQHNLFCQALCYLSSLFEFLSFCFFSNIYSYKSLSRVIL
jgi:transketolase